MTLNNNSTIFNGPVIVANLSHNEEFEIKGLADICRSSGTGEVYIDDCVKKYRFPYGFIPFTGTSQKLDDVSPYFKICGADDYLKVQEAKLNNGTIITNDYGMFTCACLEGMRPVYLPNKEQLKKGIIYFVEKILKKKLDNLTWRQLNN